MRRFLYILVFISSVLNSASLDIDSSIEALHGFAYTDQRGQKISLQKDVRVIICAFDKDTAHIVNEFLHVKNVGYLQERKVVFITDMSEAPGFFARMFAIPKLKRYEHTVYIVMDERFKESVQNIKAKATVLYIEEQTLKEALFVSTRKELERAIER